MKNTTNAKYLEVMEKIWRGVKVDEQRITQVHHITNGFVSYLIKFGLVTRKESGALIWKDHKAPTIETANEVRVRINRHINSTKGNKKKVSIKQAYIDDAKPYIMFNDKEQVKVTNVLKEELIPAYIDYLKSKGYEIYKVTREQV
jgi:hypothetical protein